MAQKQMPQHVSHLSRHPHPVSAGYTSSMAPGLILTQYFDLLQPHDTMYFQTNAFARLQDVVTAFLGEIDIHIDYFFVPLQMLYTPFGQIFAQTDDFISGIFARPDEQSNDQFPLLKVMDSLEVHSNEDFLPFMFEAWGKNCMRFLDMMDMNPYAALAQDIGDYNNILNNPNIAPWFPAAYQCIYQKYYRNEDLEHLDVRSYNFDMYWQSNDFTQDSMLKVRSVQRPHDYFTSVRPSPMYSAVNTYGGQQADETNGFGMPNTLLNKVNNFIGLSDLTQFNTGVSSTSMSTTVSTFENGEVGVASNIRALFAVDKFLRIYGRAGKTYDDQILAHFGYKVPHDVKHDITHIKHYRFSITADPVYSTSTIGTENGSTLGQVGGQGSNTLKTSQEKFTAPAHGVFMAVAYAVTRPRYIGTFNKLHLLTERLKFPIPEYDKLGMQPMYMYEAEPYAFHRNDASDYPSIGTRIGWQRRYAEFKQKYNRVSMVFANLDAFDGSEVTTNIYNPWVLSRKPFGFLREEGDDWYLDAGYFFETPKALNNVMVMPFDPAWNQGYTEAPHSVFMSDPIIFEFFCNAKKVSWMSPEGEPDL